MIFTWMHAGNEGVELFNLMGESVICEKTQRPVGDGRLRAESFF